MGGVAAEAAARESAAAMDESVRVEAFWVGRPAALSIAAAEAPVVGCRFALFVVWV